MIGKNFCSAPWSSLSIDPDGRAKICCISNNYIKFDNFDQVPVDPTFVDIRNSFIQDKQHDNCTVCWNRELNSSSGNIDSMRSIFQEEFFYDLTSDSKSQLEYLDLRWSNTCNLNCVYCGPSYSSKWASLIGLKKVYRILPDIQDHHVSNLKSLLLAGGEPFLIKENFQLLQKCLQLNPNVNIEITTNLTQIHDSQLYQLLKKFKNVRFIVSFESIEQRFEYIRNGASWEIFLNNLNLLSNDFKQIQFNMVYFTLSAGGISDAIELALKYTNPTDIFIVAQTLDNQFDKLSINAVQYLKDKNKAFANTLDDVLKNRLLDQVNSMNTISNKTVLQNYCQFDQLTNQNHKEIFKELYQ